MTKYIHGFKKYVKSQYYIPNINNNNIDSTQMYSQSPAYMLIFTPCKM